MTTSTHFNDVQPPWIAFPEIAANELVAYLKQGATEAWFDQVWRPFWVALETSQKSAYLQHWNASPEWAQAIIDAFDAPDDFDAEADARESDAHLRELREAQTAASNRPWWRRMLG